MRRILAILLLLALLCGCTGQGIPAGENQLTFYYRRADGTNDESFASETGALTEKRVTLGGDVSVEEVLEAYLQPPEDEGLVSLFPDGLRADACRGGADDDAHAAGQRGRGADPHALRRAARKSFHALDAGFIFAAGHVVALSRADGAAVFCRGKRQAAS